MKKIKFLIAGLSILSLVSCSGARAGYLELDDIKNSVSSFEDKGYSTYFYEGYLNFFAYTPEEYEVSRDNQSYDPLSTSYYLGLPTKLTIDTFDVDYQTILDKFTTTDSFDTVYCYPTEEGGLSFEVFSINKRLTIRRFGIECSAKWNAQIIYDENGYLVSENFATINSHKAPDTDSVYGECTYIYQE